MPARHPTGHHGPPEDLVRVLRAEGIRDRRVLAAFQRSAPDSGSRPAILARLANEVISVERFPALAEQARANLAAAGLGHITVIVGDGTLGIPEHAPYQAIVVSAASPRVPAPLIGAHGIPSREGRDGR